MYTPSLRSIVTLVALTLNLHSAVADEATIRKNLAERLPNFPNIDAVSKSPIPGMYEVQIGTEVVYTDEQGDHILQGNLIDTRSRANLTEARLDKLNAIDFASLPLKDALVWKQGTGARRMAVFADPNCGYCKRFERDLQQVKDVTVYTFLIPILGGDSPEKAKNIWCAKDNTSAWLDWMLRNVVPKQTTASCETPISRNLALGRKYRVNGTPSVVFEDGTRIPGAMTLAQIEDRLAASRSK